MLRDGRVAVVHRPHRQDWTLPKGKLEPGEDDLAAAVREVCEETGWLAEPGGDLGTVEYTTPDGRPKSVRWYRMRAVQRVAEPTADVDEVRWMDAGEARELLTYDLDREVLARAGL